MFTGKNDRFSRSDVKDCFRSLDPGLREAPRASISLSPTDIRRSNNNWAFRNNSRAPLRRRTHYVVECVYFFSAMSAWSARFLAGRGTQSKNDYFPRWKTVHNWFPLRSHAHTRKRKLHASYFHMHKLRLSDSLLS